MRLGTDDYELPIQCFQLLSNDPPLAVRERGNYQRVSCVDKRNGATRPAPFGKLVVCSAHHAGAAAGNLLFDFLARHHRCVAWRGRRQRAMSGAVLHGL